MVTFQLVTGGINDRVHWADWDRNDAFGQTYDKLSCNNYKFPKRPCLAKENVIHSTFAVKAEI